MSDTAAGIPTEIELKYAVPDLGALESRLEELVPEAVEAGPWRVRDVVDRYIDTSDAAIRGGGYAARLREEDGSVVLGMKSLPPTRDEEAEERPALHRRAEYESPANGTLDPAAWPPGEARALVERFAQGRPLEVRFEVRQRRREREIAAPEGAATLTLDEVVVTCQGERLGAFAALEVESRDERTGLLERLAEALESSGLVEPEIRSKEEIAAALADGVTRSEADAGPQLEADADARLEAGADAQLEADAVRGPEAPTRAKRVKAHPVLPVPKAPGISPDDTLAEAGRKVLRMQLARMLAREAGTREGEDIEELHGMRVATRRMRAAWRVFEGAYDAKVARRYVRELRGVAAALGAVRDLDVLLDAVRDYAAALPDGSGAHLEPLIADWQGRRDEARRELESVLDSGGYRRFVDDYLKFVETPGAGATGHASGAPTRVRDNAAGRTWRSYEELRAYEPGLAWADVPTLHELRIKAKRLRYTVEFFREALPPEAGLLVARVVALQDHLGALHDADVAGHLTRSFLAANAARLDSAATRAIGRYLETRERELYRLRRTVAAPWRGVAGPSFRRALGRVLAEL